jgi:hypothetical protein
MLHLSRRAPRKALLKKIEIVENVPNSEHFPQEQSEIPDGESEPFFKHGSAAGVADG